MMSDAVSLTLSAATPHMDTCELCSTPHEALRSAVVVRHARGGTLSFAACERCTAAVRRLIAAIGEPAWIAAVASNLEAGTTGGAGSPGAAGGAGAGVSGGPGTTRAPGVSGAVSASSAASGLPPVGAAEAAFSDVVGVPEVIHEFPEPLHTTDGQVFMVRAYGQGRADGTWIGWLGFVGADGQQRTTNRETSQSNREHLVYWATGLQPSYFDGAFARAST